MGIVTLALEGRFWPQTEPAKSLKLLQCHGAKLPKFGCELCQRDNAAAAKRRTGQHRLFKRLAHRRRLGVCRPRGGDQHKGSDDLLHDSLPLDEDTTSYSTAS